MVVYEPKLFVKGGSKGFCHARVACTRHGLNTRVNWSESKFQGKVARQNTWKYSVKSRKPEIKRARTFRFYLQGLLGDLSFGGEHLCMLPLNYGTHCPNKYAIALALEFLRLK